MYPEERQRVILGRARRRVLLADHTKVGNDHFARFGDLADIDTFITDHGLDAEDAAQIEATGPRIVTV